MNPTVRTPTTGLGGDPESCGLHTKHAHGGASESPTTGLTQLFDGGLTKSEFLEFFFLFTTGPGEAQVGRKLLHGRLTTPGGRHESKIPLQVFPNSTQITLGAVNQLLFLTTTGNPIAYVSMQPRAAMQ